MIYFYHLAAISFKSKSVHLIFFALLPQLVGICNVSLTLYALVRHRKALDQILPALSLVIALRGGIIPPVHDNVDIVHHRGCNDFQRRDVAMRVAFLALDCHLALHGGGGGGAGGAARPKNIKGGVGVDVEDLLMWIKGKTLASVSGSPGTTDRHDKLRFRLHLYRSRMLFVGVPPQGTGIALLVATIIQVIASEHLM